MSENEVLSNENKGMLWQLLIDNGAFNDIPNSNFNTVKSLYENTINEISHLSNNNLTDKNKLIIQTMMEKLPYLKKSQISKPLEEVQLQIDKDYETKQEEFLKLVKRPTPDEVKFNDKNDEPLNMGDMDNMLNSMMKQREDELNQISPKNPTISQKQVEESKQLDNSTNSSSSNDNSRDYVPSNTDVKREQKVAFNIHESDFISKLKKNTTQDSSVNDMLKQILTNQEQIISQLNNLSKK